MSHFRLTIQFAVEKFFRSQSKWLFEELRKKNRNMLAFFNEKWFINQLAFIGNWLFIVQQQKIFSDLTLHSRSTKTKKSSVHFCFMSITFNARSLWAFFLSSPISFYFIHSSPINLAVNRLSRPSLLHVRHKIP